jgi:lipoprotein-anchoring transpeptidase ErfK/SrfK
MLKTRPVSLPYLVFVGMILGVMLFTTACGALQSQQRADQNKARLDQLLAHAHAIGVPAAVLQPLVKQEQQLSSSRAPFNLFSDQPATVYYQNQAAAYSRLTAQTQQAITTSTRLLQEQAQRDMQNFQTALALQRSRNFGNIQAFALQFNQDQSLLATAQYPKDYVAISQSARKATQALDLLAPTYGQLNTFNNTIAQMQRAQLDVTGMQSQYQSDIQTFNNAKSAGDLQNLNNLLDAQYQQAVVASIAALPYVGAAKLAQFKAQINLLKTYSMDASAYQARLSADQALMNKAKTINDYLSFSKQIDSDIASMHDDLVQGEAKYLVQQFHQEVNAWANAHPFHDSYDGQMYALDNGYMAAGIGSDLDNDLASAYTPSDFQAMVDEANNALFNLHMLEADYNDKTPYNQVHATDLQMIAHYHLQNQQVLMISLVEQALRFYQDGKLVRSFLVTTGRQELPSVPGVWTVLNRQSPTVFKSTEPKGSPYWYPDTPIQYAILYHWGGYYVHDAWWRVNFGPGTQFPHYDTGGDESFAGNGSHGCVNMQPSDAAWVYNNTDWNTLIVVY